MTTTDTTATDTDADLDAIAAGTTTTTTTTDTADEVAKWKALSIKHEQRAKANAAAAKELETFKASQMSETEKAVAEAKAEGLAEGIRTGSTKTAQAELRAALAGRSVDADEFIAGVDVGRFIGDDGEVDRAAMVGWLDKAVPAGEQQTPVPPVLDLGQGNRGGHGAGDPAQEFAKFVRGQIKH